MIQITRHVKDDTGKGITNSADHFGATDRPTFISVPPVTLSKKSQMDRYQVNVYSTGY